MITIPLTFDQWRTAGPAPTNTMITIPLTFDQWRTAGPAVCTDTEHEHCPLHGCVEYVCCQPVDV